jgi:hypothetical protein
VGIVDRVAEDDPELADGLFPFWVRTVELPSLKGLQDLLDDPDVEFPGARGAGAAVVVHASLRLS